LQANLGTYAKFVSPDTLSLNPVAFSHVGLKKFKVTLSDT